MGPPAVNIAISRFRLPLSRSVHSAASPLRRFGQRLGLWAALIGSPALVGRGEAGGGELSAMTATPARLAIHGLYQEAPEFARRVAAGMLPPVEERLPFNPMLIEPEQRLGSYGGTWHMAMVGNETTFMRRVMATENLVTWDKDWTRVIPNVAEAFEISADARTFTFRLRAGMRWSDGEPFTAADVVFWYQAVYCRDEFRDLIPPTLDLGPDGLRVEQLDERTVVFRFAQPYGLFLQRLATLHSVALTSYPRHFLARYHQDFNPDADQLAKQEGAANWTELFRRKSRQNWINAYMSSTPGFPVISAWMYAPGSFHPDGTPAAIVTAVRNPYYWKIDTEYRQLPYIDRLEFTVVATPSDILPLVQAGRIDMQERNIPIAAAAAENQARGGYGVFKLISSFSNYLAISFNQTHDDPIKRQIFKNRDFRIGLSHAINRAAIIRAAGLDAQPWQAAPLPGTPFYSEQMATQYLEYNVALANEYLDRAGFRERDAEGFRLGPDHRPIRFSLLVPVPVAAGEVDVHLPMIQADWRAVGIDLVIERVPRAEADRRWARNDYDAGGFTGAGGYDVLLAPRHYVPAEGFWSQQGIRWSNWFRNPRDPEAEEPTGVIKESLVLWREVLQTTDVDRQNELMRRIIAIATDQFQVIGIHQVPVSYGVVKKNFHNVPALMFSSANYPQPAPTNPCQYWIEAETAGATAP